MTGYVEGDVLPDKTAYSIFIFILKNVYTRWGPCEIKMHDNGKEFCNKIQEMLDSFFGTRKITITPYRPQLNGLAEANIAIIKDNMNRVSNTPGPTTKKCQL